MRSLELDRVEDPAARDNFRRINEGLVSAPILQGKFKFFTWELADNNSPGSYPLELRLRHGLSFVPKDVIQTSAIGAGSVTWNFADFDADYLYATITGPVTVRAFVGSYQEGSRA
jgi:hypothetical protein